MSTAAAFSTTALLDVRLFGTPEALVRGEPLRPLHSRRGLWLLAILALNGAKHTDRSRLAGLLWPDSPDATALHNLRQTLADLRRALGPASGAIVSDTPRSLRLDLACVRVDAAAFDLAVTESTPASLRSAADLYRGPLLADCDEPWAAEARRAREEVYLNVLDRLARESGENGDHGSASQWLRLAIEVDPYREAAHRALMESLAAAGERTAAMDVYRALRLRLHHELNAAPDPETTALFRRLRSGSSVARTARAVPPQRARMRSLPATRTELIGRDGAVQHVNVLLQRNRLVTLMGAGGIGKTSLAIRVANDTEEEYDDGVIFVPLGALADPRRVPDVVREEAGLGGTHDSRDSTTVVQEFFAARRCLLVLDNCEHLLSACADLADSLLTRCPGLRILATSRHALGIGGETVWRLPSLDLPPEGEGEVEDSAMRAYPAIELFVTRASAGEPSFRLTSANTPTVVDICRRLDGIPLAIELVAARVRSLPVLEISRRLREDMNLLAGIGSGTVPRHHTLEAAFRWSWDLLTPAERAILGRLSIFAGGWTLDAAGEVCVDSGMRREDVVDLLASLVDKSLVIYEAESFDPDEEAGPALEPRYHLLEPIRQFAAARLRESGGEGATACRHLSYHLALAEQGATGPFGPVTAERAKWFDDLRREHDNLRAALAFAAQNGPGREPNVSVRLCRALAPLWFTQGHWTEARHWLECALADSDGISPLRADALCAAGTFAANQGDHSQAAPLVEQAHEMFRAVDDGAGQARALNGLGNIAYAMDDYVAASARYSEGLRLARDAGDDIVAARLLCNLRGVAQRQDESRFAAAYYEEALAIYRANADIAGTGLALHGKGCTLQAQAEYEAARECYAESLEIKRRLGTKSEIALLLTNLAHLAFEMGDLDTATTHDEECLRIRRGCGDQLGVAQALANLASIAAYRGEHARARELCSESRPIYEAHGARRGLSYLLDTMGRLALSEGDHVDARSRFAASLRIRRDIGHRLGAIESLESMAFLEAAAHRPERATPLLAASAALRQHHSYPVSPFKQAALNRQIREITTAVTDDEFQEFWSAGSVMAFDTAVIFALEGP